MAKRIQDIFPGSAHLNRMGLELPVPDPVIWDYALKNAFHILTQDDDFQKLSAVLVAPPKVIMLEAGNISTQRAEQIVCNNLDAIETFLNHPHKNLLQLF